MVGLRIWKGSTGVQVPFDSVFFFSREKEAVRIGFKEPLKGWSYCFSGSVVELWVPNGEEGVQVPLPYCFYEVDR